ncbi:ChaN family lipoprotein [Vibrio sp. ZSDZ65]|uniref:ChaN family lipoprotein n=1 Tax=Vibrio qingdaonensis TaxID=2829491 RepID=A0A9X3CKC1_9VIBR|nr:ChaN family lipoprotein [Vibrio qingdaonensis]MCW8344891.1 ChaN family lipoprotein [Vibrio qingdaonensis]
MKFLPIALLASLITGCASSLTTAPSSAAQVQPQPIDTFYDYQLYTATGDPIVVSALPEAIINADVILVGEWHTHSAIHRFQTDLLRSLATNNDKLALSMEQFSRPSQTIVNDYLKGNIGEQTLMSEANAWPNYQSDYRALVEFAKQNQLPIIASNAPKSTVRCIGRTGLSYLDTLEPPERRYVAQTIDTSGSPYKEKFMNSMHHGTPDQTAKQFAAQLTWDATMAESIVHFLRAHPDTQVMHIAGKFHTENGLGTASQILKLEPKLNVLVISPVVEITNADTPATSADMQLLVLPPPTRYVQEAKRMSAYQHLGKRNDGLKCTP